MTGLDEEYLEPLEQPPSFKQGWGRLNLTNSLHFDIYGIPKVMYIHDNKELSASNNYEDGFCRRGFFYDKFELRVTLADVADERLVNDLDLELLWNKLHGHVQDPPSRWIGRPYE